ncbi:hypothetical protein BT96DRAFT_219315 [Gymnopus androsaceus JB14]|uniref:Nuclear pore complex protein NUP96 C-terminal domain-containing protein n=1 Tax=Gymnopus androsaceus JB14 TaxID=1447944 RepID=A0A6A4H6Y3_9AGAR|nr:hypothetical protein BT96DRAFT_219315 [Gymnopus androsaceus JB14]
MRVRDFPDRGDACLRDDTTPLTLINSSPSPSLEGHSPTADLLTSAYALQLEYVDMVQEAAFVLLHLEPLQGGSKAIQDLLIRSAPKLDEWNIRGLVGSLKIPLKWIKEAQAIYALNTFNHPSSSILSLTSVASPSSIHPVCTAYELFLAAGNLDRANDIAILSLAQDTVLCNDWVLLKELFSPFVTFSGDSSDRGRVEGWYVRGKAFLDYANIMMRITALLPSDLNH